MYVSPSCPDCIGCVSDQEFCFCWPFITKTGCRQAGGAKFITIETCVRAGGYNCCIASACAFPPDEKVPLGCGCCDMGSMGDVTLDGLGLDFKNDTSLHTVCLCAHCALFSDFPKCCGGHMSGSILFFTVLQHMALDPVETCMKVRAQQCCFYNNETCCPQPCYPFCKFQSEPICC